MLTTTLMVSAVVTANTAFLLLSMTFDYPGVAAAVVQVVGLLRWPLVVPHVTDPETFAGLNTVLGTVLGETLGYLLTAVWTVWTVRYHPTMSAMDNVPAGPRSAEVV